MAVSHTRACARSPFPVQRIALQLCQRPVDPQSIREHASALVADSVAYQAMRGARPAVSALAPTSSGQTGGVAAFTPHAGRTHLSRVTVVLTLSASPSAAAHPSLISLSFKLQGYRSE